MTISELIHDRRIELNLTLEQVGDACGVGKSTVRKWEKGMIKNIGSSRLVLLADILQLPVTHLVGTQFINDDPQRKLSDLEQQLLSVFRTLDPAGQQALLSYAIFLSSNPSMKKE